MEMGIDLIAAERKRQIEKEGFDAGHDDAHTAGELAAAAVSYANEEAHIPGDAYYAPPRGWPFGEKWWKPSTRIRNLSKAGAFCAAEIDRLRREEMASLTGPEQDED